MDPARQAEVVDFFRYPREVWLAATHPLMYAMEVRLSVRTRTEQSRHFRERARLMTLLEMACSSLLLLVRGFVKKPWHSCFLPEWAKCTAPQPFSDASVSKVTSGGRGTIGLPL